MNTTPGLLRGPYLSPTPYYFPIPFPSPRFPHFILPLNYRNRYFYYFHITLLFSFHLTCWMFWVLIYDGDIQHRTLYFYIDAEVWEYWVLEKRCLAITWKCIGIRSQYDGIDCCSVYMSYLMVSSHILFYNLSCSLMSIHSTKSNGNNIS